MKTSSSTQQTPPSSSSSSSSSSSPHSHHNPHHHNPDKHPLKEQQNKNENVSQKGRKRSSMSYTQQKQHSRYKRRQQHRLEQQQQQQKQEEENQSDMPLSSLSFSSMSYSSITNSLLASSYSASSSSSLSITSSSSTYFLPMFLLLLLSLYWCKHTLLPLATASPTITTNTTHENKNNTKWKVPFYYFPSSTTTTTTSTTSPPFHHLSKALSTHATQIQTLLSFLLKQEELTRKNEWIIFGKHGDSQELPLMASKMRQKIYTLAQVLEWDLDVLKRIVVEFDLVLGLPSPPSSSFVVRNNGAATTTSFFDSKKKDIDSTTNDFETKEERAYMSFTTSKTFHPTKESEEQQQQQEEKYSSYDSTQQILTHIVRDYTHAGRAIRSSLYTWILQKIDLYLKNDDIHDDDDDNEKKKKKKKKKGKRVLIPGAALGRLGLEICSQGYYDSVEMNDVSIVMASAAHYFLHFKPLIRQNHDDDEEEEEETTTTKKEEEEESSSNNNTQKKTRSRSNVIHPFAFDSCMNEVQTNYRFDEFTFPDEEYSATLQQSLLSSSSSPVVGIDSGWNRKLWYKWFTSKKRNKQNKTKKKSTTASYTIGNFVSTYSSPAHFHHYHTIVTCFFLDTATNIYEYLLVIRHLLSPNNDNDDDDYGLWINVGPLQWHQNAKIQLSGDELRELIVAFGFEILEWSVDLEAVNYRSVEEEEEEEDEDLGGRRGGKKKKSSGFTRYTKMTESYYPLRFVARRTKNIEFVQSSSQQQQQQKKKKKNQVHVDEKEEEEEEERSDFIVDLVNQDKDENNVSGTWKLICKLRESMRGGGGSGGDGSGNDNGDNAKNVKTTIVINEEHDETGLKNDYQQEHIEEEEDDDDDDKWTPYKNNVVIEELG